LQAYHENKRFGCSFEGCDARLSTRGALSRHMKLCHENLKKPKARRAPR
jgi:hypothetical protein